jgi:hypothetical protein
MSDRLRIITFSTDFLFDCFRTGEHPLSRYAVVHGLPEDAELVNVRHGWLNTIELLIRSAEFELLEDGELPRHMVPTIKKICPEMPVPSEEILAQDAATAYKAGWDAVVSELTKRLL